MSKIKLKKKRNDQLLLGKEHNVYKLKLIVYESNNKCEDAGGWYLCIIMVKFFYILYNNNKKNFFWRIKLLLLTHELISHDPR